MSALVAHPAWQPARPERRRGTARPGQRPGRRGTLELVGPGFVPRPAPLAAPVTETPEVVAPAPAAVAVARPEPAPLRLTRRGRAVLAAVALVVAGAVSVGIGVAAALTVQPGTSHQTEAVTVTAGDTLWVLAAGAAGAGEDVRDVVAQIAELNGLSSHELHAGQQLLVPVG